MTDKEALDRLDSINLSLEQKTAIIDVIKNIAGNNSNTNINKSIIFTLDYDAKLMNMYDKNYPIEIKNDNIHIYSTELYNKIYSDLLNGRKFVIKIISELENYVFTSDINSYYILDEMFIFGIIFSGIETQFRINKDK